MPELPGNHQVSAHKDIVGQVMHRWKHRDPKPLHSGRGKGGKEGKIVKSQDQAIAIALSMAGKSKDHAEKLMSIGYSEAVAYQVAEMLHGNFDFSTCERPNGSRYGTGGKCRKGTEVSPREEKPNPYKSWADNSLRDHVNSLLNKVDPDKLSKEDRKAYYTQVKDIIQELKSRGVLIGGYKNKGSETKRDTTQKTLDDLLKKEQEARIKGDTEAARKFMREHMNLVNEIEAERKLPKKKTERTRQKDAQQIQLERLEERLDNAVTVKEQQRISSAIKDLLGRMTS